MIEHQHQADHDQCQPAARRGERTEHDHRPSRSSMITPAWSDGQRSVRVANARLVAGQRAPDGGDRSAAPCPGRGRGRSADSARSRRRRRRSPTGTAVKPGPASGPSADHWSANPVPVSRWYAAFRGTPSPGRRSVAAGSELQSHATTTGSSVSVAGPVTSSSAWARVRSATSDSRWVVRKRNRLPFRCRSAHAYPGRRSTQPRRGRCSAARRSARCRARGPGSRHRSGPRSRPAP